MRHGVRKERVIKTFGCRGNAIAGADMNAHRHVEPLGFSEERKQIRIVEILFRRRYRRGGDRDKFEILNGAPKLLRRFRRILDGDRGDAFEPAWIGFAIIRQPVVVDARNSASQIFIFDERQAQKW